MKYFCEKCIYETEKKYDYDRHLTSKKHAQNTKKIYTCKNCNAIYNVRQSLYAHKKKCQENKITNLTIDNDINLSNNDLKMQLVLAKKDLEIEKIKIEHE